MTGYHTRRGQAQRYRSDMSVRDCIHLLRRVGYDDLREGNTTQDLNGIDLVSTLNPRLYQHKAQFDAGWFNLNIQVREWGAQSSNTHYIWHHKPTETVLVIEKSVVMQHQPTNIVHNSNQPFYSINCNVFRDGWGGWIDGVTLIREGNLEVSFNAPCLTGGEE